jgi:aldose 1-epimerase
MTTIESTTARVTLAPAAGGRIARLEAIGRDLLITGDEHDHPMAWGSFPMAPWAGRIRHGRFVHDGRTVTLALTLPPHAAHGTTYLLPWSVVDHDPSAVVLDCDLAWELGGSARQRISVDDDGVECELSVRAGDRAMPAEVGWHPWFAKPDSLEFTPTAMYRRDADGIPDGTTVAPPPGPWDDCFVNTAPIVLHYGDASLTLTSDCDHWVVYDEPEHATCVEPQSGPPDAFNLAPRVLQPGEELSRWYRIAWDG